MKTKRTVQLLLICLFVLAAACSEAFAQKRQGGVPDSVANTRVTKSIVSKSDDQKSFGNKQQAEVKNLRYSRMYSASDLCAYETDKGLRCKRKAMPNSRFCRQHDERFAVKDGPDKRK